MGCFMVQNKPQRKSSFPREHGGRVTVLLHSFPACTSDAFNRLHLPDETERSLMIGLFVNVDSGVNHVCNGSEIHCVIDLCMRVSTLKYTCSCIFASVIVLCNYFLYLHGKEMYAY